MPFSNAPTNDSYSSHRTSLVTDILLRPGATTLTRDAGMKNALPFKEGEEMVAHSRYRLDFVGEVSNSATAVCRGMYVWEKSSVTYVFYVVYDGGTSKVYTSTDSINFTAVNTLGGTAVTPVGFTEFIDATNVKKLVLVTGTEGYVFTDNTAGTKITDVDFPSPHVPFPVFLDGYLFLAKASTGDIYNSDLNDPAAWTAGSFISSELYPDDVVALVKVENYLLAVGTKGCEYFYDAATATGSPLARQEGAALPFGTHYVTAIAASKSIVVMLADNSDGEGTFKVIEGTKYKDIPSAVPLRLLTQYFSGNLGVPSSEVPTASDLRGYFFRQSGDLFYAFSYNGLAHVRTDRNSYSPTFVYSFKHEMWSEFSTIVNGTDVTFPVNFTNPAAGTGNYTYIAGQFGTRFSSKGVFFGVFAPGNDASGDLDSFPVLTQFRTSAQDYGTLNQKTMSRVAVALESMLQDVSFTVSYTDDDYNNYSTGRSVTTGNSYSYPFITQLGSFRRRAFKLIQTAGAASKWKYIEVDINKGQQ